MYIHLFVYRFWLSKHPAGGKDTAAGRLLFYIEMSNYRRKINFTYN